MGHSTFSHFPLGSLDSSTMFLQLGWIWKSDLFVLLCGLYVAIPRARGGHWEADPGQGAEAPDRHEPVRRSCLRTMKVKVCQATKKTQLWS